MRYQHLKLKKHHSTKTERKAMEILKKYHIPFKVKMKIGKYEVDFLLENYAIELDAHEQNPIKNHFLLRQGYIPLHFANWKLDEFEEWLRKTICQ